MLEFGSVRELFGSHGGTDTVFLVSLAHSSSVFVSRLFGKKKSAAVMGRTNNSSLSVPIHTFMPAIRFHVVLYPSEWSRWSARNGQLRSTFDLFPIIRPAKLWTLPLLLIARYIEHGKIGVIKCWQIVLPSSPQQAQWWQSLHLLVSVQYRKYDD